METEPEYFHINPLWSGFKRPRFVIVWEPILDPLSQHIKWVRKMTPIKTGYRNWDYPSDDIRHYNPLSILDIDL